MDRPMKIFLIAGAVVVLAVIGWMIASMVGISSEHHSMESGMDLEGYGGLYTFDSSGMKEVSAESIGEGSFVFMGDDWAQQNKECLMTLLKTWIDNHITIVTPNCSVFDPLKENVATDFEPSACLHAICSSGGTSFCLSLTCDDDWMAHVLDPGWRSTERSVTVSESAPCCISTSVYQSGKYPDIVSTNMYWMNNGRILPIWVKTDEGLVPFSPNHGFACVNFLDFVADGMYMNKILIETSAGEGVSYPTEAIPRFQEGRIAYNLPAGSGALYWSVPRSDYSPSTAASDHEREDGAGNRTIMEYKFSVPPEIQKVDGDFTMSAGGSFFLIDDSVKTFEGTCLVHMMYQDGLHKHTFDIETEFNLPIE